jgi:predicted ArsR family transcriptional regulator
MAKLILRKPEQWEALFSPVRLEIVQNLELHGPSSIAEIAGELGRTPHSLYHHFHKLVEVEILQIDETRRIGRRDEAVYSVQGRPVILSYEPDNAETRELRVKAASSLLRQAARDYERSLQSATRPAEQPEVRRYRVRLRPSSAKQIQKHLNAIVQLILDERVTADSGGRDRRWYTWLSLLAPQPPEEQPGIDS